MTHKSSYKRLVVLVLASLVFAACGPASVAQPSPAATAGGVATQAALPTQAAPAEPIEMVHSWWADPNRLNPVSAGDGFSYTYNMLVFDGLTELDEDGVPQPALAERWEVSEDGKVYTFHLRSDVTWHDGEPFTADDVVFTVYAHLNPANGSIYVVNYQALVGFEELTRADNPASPDDLEVKPVEALDDHTVVFRLQYPYAPFLGILQTYRGAIVPQHLLEGEDMLNSAFNKNPVGTGRFKFVEWRESEYVEFAANEDYYRGRPIIDKLLIRNIPDRTVAVEELKAGNLHYYYNVPSELLEGLMAAPSVETMFVEAPNWTGMMLDVENPVLSDRAVRQALMYGLNREALVQVVYRGQASVATGPITPAHGSWAFNSELQPYPYDPERAATMLTEAGWQPGADGTREKDGMRLSFEIIYSVNQEYGDLFTFMQEQWRQIGVEVIAGPLDNAAWLERVTSRDFDATITRPSGWPDPDPETYAYFHSEGPQNSGHYSNPEVDRLLEQGRQYVTVEDRGPVYYELQQLLHDDVPWIWLAWRPWSHHWSTEFAGYGGGPHFPVGSYYTLHMVGPR